MTYLAIFHPSIRTAATDPRWIFPPGTRTAVFLRRRRRRCPPPLSLTSYGLIHAYASNKNISSGFFKNAQIFVNVMLVNYV